MNKVKTLAAVVILTLLSSCENRFPTDKRYWDANDYYKVIKEIQYKTPKGEEYPRFSNPETAVVIQKLIDPENYRVILDDPELGILFKSEVSEEFFNHSRNLVEVYGVMDQQDKYVYADELAEILNFGLGVQRSYFKLGNERIKTESDTKENRNVIKKNEQVLVDNYVIFLSQIIESRFGPEACVRLANGISSNFKVLIDQYPEANYKAMRAKASSLQEKVNTPELKTALTELVSQLDVKLQADQNENPI